MKLNPFGGMKFEGLVKTVYPKGINPNLLDYFKGKKLTQVTALMIEDYRKKRLSKVKPASVNRELAALKHCFKEAVRFVLIEKDPCNGLRLEKEKPRMKWLTPEDEAKLFRVSPEWLRELILIAVHTGMRSTEITSLTWDRVDFEHGEILVTETKNNEPRTIQMNQVVLDLLRSKDRSDLYGRIFPRIDKFKVSKAFKQACEKAGLKDFRFHDCRHTFGSRLSQAGVNVFEIKTALGHKTLVMSERYSHSSTDSQRLAVKQLEKFSCEWQRERAIEGPKNDSTDFIHEPLAQQVEQLTLNQ